MNNLAQHVEDSLSKANNDDSGLTDEILDIEGMSGRKTRHFYNNLCSAPDVRYLEIGTWKGSTFCSAMYNNNITCLGIDNWSLFGGPKEEFLQNFNKFRGDNNAAFIEKSCWEVDVSAIGKFNIYMYDGKHTKNSQYQALNYYLPCLDDEFIFIVDDWNEGRVQHGTLDSIKDNNLDITYRKEIFSDRNPGAQRSDNAWHNGIGIFILQFS